MGHYQGIPQYTNFSELCFGTENEIFYKKKTSERISLQWIGWQNLKFSGKVMKVSNIQFKYYWEFWY